MTLCNCECDEGHHDEDCPQPAADMAYWARYFGQDYGTRAERRARLEAMDPRPQTEEQRIAAYDIKREWK